MVDRIIFTVFALIFFLIPLAWTPLNFELFEYNKMILTYLLTSLVVGLWLFKMISEKTLILKRTPLDIPILLFLVANILSTIYSIDPHTSWWGYYSRSNGGLLSIISYTLLFFAFVSNINSTQALKLLKIGLASGLIISLWGIFEHFGVSPSCVILRGELNANCWVQDVQARVFATLGQPNWMAAYLAMLIFPMIYFCLTAKNLLSLTTYYLLLTTYYLAFTFTYSRGGSLGFFTSLAIFLLGVVAVSQKKNWKKIIIVLTVFLLTNLLFASSFTEFKLIKKAAPPPRPNIATSNTQLENGGGESGQIRLVVWQGALEIFKHYPIFGTGVETFAYSYYNFRPTSHNLTSEWDFLYNKAHNEFLNYLANTGIVGFFTYILLIFSFLVWSLRKILDTKLNMEAKLLVVAVLASFISFLVQNIFGFSVVIIAIFFYIFPGLAFILTGSSQEIAWAKRLTPFLKATIYKRPIYGPSLKILIVFTTLYFVYAISRVWFGDITFAQGERSNELGNVGRAYNYLSLAVSLNPGEPFYKSELGYAAASSAVSLADTDATLSGKLKKEALAETEKSLEISPKNVSFFRTAIRTYYQLSAIDEKYLVETLKVLDKAIVLAPTDPKLYYNKAVILGQTDEIDEAIKVLQKAIELKPNYKEAVMALALFYFDQGDKQKAVETVKTVLKITPNDPEATEQLADWGKQGIATNSANQK